MLINSSRVGLILKHVRASTFSRGLRLNVTMEHEWGWHVKRAGVTPSVILRSLSLVYIYIYTSIYIYIRLSYSETKSIVLVKYTLHFLQLVYLVLFFREISYYYFHYITLKVKLNRVVQYFLVYSSKAKQLYIFKKC